MSIAPETYRSSPFLAPPPDDFGVQRYPRVYFEDSAAARKRAQNSAELLFEVAGLVSAALMRPGPHRVVDVSEHLEIVPGIHHAADFRQVTAHNRRRLRTPVTIGDLNEGIGAVMQRVLAADHQIKAALA